VQRYEKIEKEDAAAAKTETITVEQPTFTEATVTSRSHRIRTLQDLLKAARIDKGWRVRSWSANAWEMMGKGDTPVQLYQVKAQLERAPEYLAPLIREPISFRRTASRSGGVIKRAVILPDTQHGYRWDATRRELDPLHDDAALAVTVRLIKDVQPDAVILLGDHLDLAPWSMKFPREQSLAYTTQPAIEALHSWLATIRKAAPSAVIRYMGGNHEDRIQRVLVDRLSEAEELRPADDPTGHSMLSIPRLLALDGLDIEYLPYGDEYWLWDTIRIHHGHTARKGGGRTVAALAEGAQHHEIVGHVHRLELCQRTLHGPEGQRVITVMSPGCLCRLDGVVPAAAPRNDWQQGVGLVSLDVATGDVTMLPVPIYGGRLLWHGTVISA
jgi:hypothetical protein